MKKLKGAIYARVSTDKQEYARQLAELENYAERNDISIDYIFEETQSGLESNRPEYNKLIKLGKEDIDIVLIWELSRLSRKSVEIQTDIQNFKDKGINVYIHDRSLYVLNKDGTENSTANLIIAIISTIAQEEIKTMRHRIISTKQHNVLKKGKSYTSQAAFGYDLVDGHLEINEEEAKIVKRIYKLSAEGNSFYSIAVKLNAEGSLKRWTGSSIKTMLENTAYYGRARYVTKSKKVKSDTAKRGYSRVIKESTFVDCPAIITKDLFDLVQEKKKQRQSRSAAKVGTPYLLKHLIRCKTCETFMTIDRASDRIRYRCARQFNRESNKPKCITPIMESKNMDFIVWDLVIRKYRKDYLAGKKEEDIEKLTKQVGAILAIMQSIEEQKSLKEKEVMDTFTEYQSIKTKFPNLTKLITDLDTKLGALERDIKRLDKEIDKYRGDIRKIEGNIEAMSSIKEEDLDKVDFDGKYEFLHKIVDYIHFFRTKENRTYHLRIFLKSGVVLDAFYNSQKRFYQYMDISSTKPLEAEYVKEHYFDKVNETAYSSLKTVKIPLEK